MLGCFSITGAWYMYFCVLVYWQFRDWVIFTPFSLVRLIQVSTFRNIQIDHADHADHAPCFESQVSTFRKIQWVYECCPVLSSYSAHLELGYCFRQQEVLKKRQRHQIFWNKFLNDLIHAHKYLSKSCSIS